MIHTYKFLPNSCLILALLNPARPLELEITDDRVKSSKQILEKSTNIKKYWYYPCLLPEKDLKRQTEPKIYGS